MADGRQVAKKTPARKAAKATKSTTAVKATPAKKTAAQKVTPAKSTTRARGAARTSAPPAAVVEEQAVAAARPRRRAALDPDRPAARAARAMRGEPDPAPDAELSFAEQVDARVAQLRAEAADDEEANNLADGISVVPFHGRDLRVRLPSEEQLTMYRRVSREFVALGKSGRAKNMPIEEALKYLDRAVRTVQSVLADDDDREWIEDQLMDGKLKLVECSELMQEAFRRLAEQHGTRQERRAAGQRGPAAALED